MDNAEPTRYRVASIQHQMTYGGGVLESDPDGPIVAYGDYARLKAEVERLTFDPMSYLDDQGEWMPRHIHLAAVERLKAEVERLTKAGDAMASIIKYEPGVNTFDPVPDVVKRWNAAKEGKQSK
jgi:hypothetical protein